MFDKSKKTNLKATLRNIHKVKYIEKEIIFDHIFLILGIESEALLKSMSKELSTNQAVHHIRDLLEYLNCFYSSILAIIFNHDTCSMYEQ